MVINIAKWMKISNRKSTGSRYKKMSKKHKCERGRDFVPATIGASKVVKNRTRGGGQKLVVYKTESVNVMSKGKAQKAKLVSVSENTADPHYVRRNVVTKGAVVETDIGKVRITSRPGQDGVLNGVLVEKK